MNDQTGKENNIENRIKNAPDAVTVHCLKSQTSVLRKLLAASKDAEVLIACLFEQHLFTATPLTNIWERLAVAIEEAQTSLKAQGPDVP